jgi:hypothetical protein
MRILNRMTLIPALAASLALAASSCYVGVAPEQGTVAAAVYQPLYHDGYAVYYNDGGQPYYYVNGAIVYVPSTSAYYAGYTNHYRTHRSRYHTWNATHGQRYRTYRGSTPTHQRGTVNRGHAKGRR